MTTRHITVVSTHMGESNRLNEFALTAADLGEAMSRSASVLAEGGSTFEESLGMLTAMIEVTQDASTSGNAAKILTLRLRGMKGELEELGEEVDENVESISKMQTQVLNLTHGKVNIFDDNGSFKSTYEIMKGIAEIYDQLSDTEQASLLETIAGKHRSNQVAALIQNWEQVEKATVAAQNAQGTAYHENAVYMESLQGKLDSLSASWQAFANDFLNSSFVKGVVDTIRNVIDALDSLVDVFGALPIVIGAVGIVALVKNFGKLAEKIKETTVGMKAMQALGKAKGFLGALSAPQIAGIVIALTAVASIIGVVAKKSEELEEKIQDAKAASEDFSDTSKSLEDYRKRAEELREQLDSNALSEEEAYSAKAELLSIQNELNESFADGANKLNLLTGSIENQFEALNRSEAENFLNSNVEAIEKATQEIEKTHIYDVLKNMWTFNGEDKEFLSKVKGITDELDNFQFTDSENFFKITYTGNAEEAEEELNGFLNKVRELEDDYGNTSAYTKIFTDTSESINKARNILVEYQEIYRQGMMAQLAADKTNPFENFDTSTLHESLQDVSTFSDLYIEYAEAIADYNDALASGDTSKIAEAKERFDAVKGAIEQINLGEYQGLFDELTATVDTTSESMHNFAEAIGSGRLAGHVKKLMGMSDNQLSMEVEKLASGALDADGSLTSLWYEAQKLGIVSGKSSEEIWKVVDMMYQLADVEVDFDPSVKSVEELADIYNTAAEEAKDYATAIQESASATGLSAESIALLESRFSGLDGYDKSKLFEKTANGIHLNETQLKLLNQQYENLNRADFETKVQSLKDRYRDLADQLGDVASGTQEYQDILSEMHGIEGEIEQVKILQSQYEGLISSYNKWEQAKSGGNDRDSYAGIQSGYEDMKEILDAGWYGDESLNAYLDLMLSVSERTGDAVTDFAKLDSTIAGTSHSMMDYFQVDGDGKLVTDGLYDFLDDVNKVFGDSYASVDEKGVYSFDLTGERLQEVADRFGMSTELVEIFAKALADSGADVSFDEADQGLEEILASAGNAEAVLKAMNMTVDDAIVKLDELGLLSEFDFNIDTASIDDVNGQLTKAQEVLDTFRDPNTGKLNIEAEGYDETVTLIASLIKRKQELAREQIVVLKADASQAEGETSTLISSLQSLYSNYESRELNATLQADTSGAEQNIQQVAKEIEQLPDSVKQEILADTNVDLTTFNNAISDIANTKVEAGVSCQLNQGSIDTVISAISSISGEALVKCGIETAQVDNYMNAEHNSDGTVKWNNDTTAVDSYANKKKNSSGEVEWDNDISRVKKTFYAKGTVRWSGTGGSDATGTATTNKGYVRGSAFKKGTAFASGTAYESGDWGAKDSGTALMGELGEELIVRDGKYFTVGEDSAGFFQYRKGDIIFNAAQTREIFKYGKINRANPRGYAYAEGTAFGAGGTGGRRKKTTTKKKSSSSSKKKSTKKETASDKNLDKFKDWFEKLFDWIEVQLERQTDRISNYVQVAERQIGHGNYNGARNNYVSAISGTADLAQTQQDASAQYRSKANAVLSKAKSQKLITSKELEVIKQSVADGKMVISDYPERIREVISAYQEWDDKAREASQSVSDLTDQIQEYVNALHDVSIAQRDANLGKIDNRRSIVDSLYAAKSDWVSWGVDGTRLSYENTNLGNEAQEYANAVSRSNDDKNNLANSAKGNINSQLNSKNAKKDAKYKQALNNAKAAMNATKKVASGDMSIIKKYSTATYEKIYAYNLSIDKLEEAKMEWAVEYAAKNSEVYANIAEQYQLKDDISQNKIDQWERKAENATTASSKNGYLESMIKEQDNILENDRAEIDRYNGYLNNAKNTIKSNNGLGGYIKNLSKNGQATVKKWIDYAKNQASKGQAISAECIAKLGEWYTKGWVSAAFYTSCINYNNSLEHKREAEAQYAIDVETAKAEKAALAMQKVENIQDEYDNSFNNIDRTKNTIERKHSMKETRGIALTSSDYQELIANSIDEQKLNQDVANAVKRQIDDNVAKGYWTTNSQEYKDAMQSYYDYLDAAEDCAVAQEEYNNTIANLPYERFEKALAILDAISEVTKSELELRDAQGLKRTFDDYQSLMDENKNRIQELTNQQNQLYQDYLKAVGDKDGVYGGKTAQEWLNEYNQIIAEINGVKKENEELKDELRDDVYWRDFERAHTEIERMRERLEGIDSLIEETMYYNDDGTLSDFGVAKIANLTKSYELARQEVENYSNDIDNLNRLYGEGQYTEDEYNEKLSELQSGLLDAASSMKEYRDSVIDMFKQTGQQELDSLFELIDARNDALSAKKAYYDYDKNIRNQTKEIDSLQSQIAALEGIETAEARAKRARLEEELATAQEELDDTITEHTMELSQNSLDGLKESLQDAFDDKWEEISKSLNSMNQIMQQAYDLSTSESSTANNAINAILASYGISSSLLGNAESNIQLNSSDLAGMVSEYNSIVPKLYQRTGGNNSTLPVGNNSQQVVQNYDALIKIEGSADAATVQDLKNMQIQLLDEAYNYTSTKIYQNLIRSGTVRTV